MTICQALSQSITYGIKNLRNITLLGCIALSGCNDPHPSQKSEKNVLHICNWADFIPPEILTDFEKETGIRVFYDVFESPEALETKLLAASSGYDLVFPSAFPDLVRQIPLGIYLPLDLTKIPSASGVDPKIMKALEAADPGNLHALPYAWGTTGFVYRVDLVEKICPQEDHTSLDMLFSLPLVKRLGLKGISLLNSPLEVFPMALLYLKKDPNSHHPDDLKQATDLLMDLKKTGGLTFDSFQFINRLLQGEICVAHTWSSYGNAVAARSAPDKPIRYVLPKEGGFLWFDTMAIPRDAPHPHNAHIFINFILRPEIMAKVTQHIRTANPVPASYPLIPSNIRRDKGIFPPKKILERFHLEKPKSMVYERLRARAWAAIKSG